VVSDENPKNPVVFSETQKTHIKEKEKEKEKEVVVPPYPPTGGTTTTTSYVGDNLRGMTGGNWEELRSYLEDGIPMELVNHAVDEAAANGKRNWAYVRRILNRYLDEGITTVEQAKNVTKKPTRKVDNSLSSRHAKAFLSPRRGTRASMMRSAKPTAGARTAQAPAMSASINTCRKRREGR
jgi:DnaD/phage-associated family protein